MSVTRKDVIEAVRSAEPQESVNWFWLEVLGRLFPDGRIAMGNWEKCERPQWGAMWYDREADQRGFVLRIIVNSDDFYGTLKDDNPIRMSSAGKVFLAPPQRSG